MSDAQMAIYPSPDPDLQVAAPAAARWRARLAIAGMPIALLTLQNAYEKSYWQFQGQAVKRW